MKKTSSCIFFAIFLSLVIVFAGCGNLAPTKTLETQKAFTAHMSAKKGEKTFCADIICSSYEDIVIAFTNPEELKSFTISTTKDGYSVDAYGLKNILDYKEISEKSFLNILVNTIKTTVFTNHGQFMKNKNDNTYCASLTINNVPVKTVFNSDGYMIALESEQAGFSAEFFY